VLRVERWLLQSSGASILRWYAKLLQPAAYLCMVNKPDLAFRVVTFEPLQLTAEGRTLTD
jgi:hypothetical protein